MRKFTVPESYKRIKYPHWLIQLVPPRSSNYLVTPSSRPLKLAHRSIENVHSLRHSFYRYLRPLRLFRGRTPLGFAPRFYFRLGHYRHRY